MEISGKIVVVTGASMGIGEAVAKIFADHGAKMVLLSRDAARAEAARNRIGHTENTIALSCDVRNREEIDRVVGLPCITSGGSLCGSTTRGEAWRARSRAWIPKFIGTSSRPTCSGRLPACRRCWG